MDFFTGIDDMIIWGEESIGDNHNKHLTMFLQATRPHNLKFNLDKLQFKPNNLVSLGSPLLLMAHTRWWQSASHEQCATTLQCERSSILFGYGKLLKTLSKDWQSLTITWQSSERRMHHLCGAESIMRHWSHQNRDPNAIMFIYYEHNKLQSSYKRTTKFILPGKVSSLINKHMLQLSLSYFQFLVPWWNFIHFLFVKRF